MLASHDKEPWTQIEWKWLVTKLTRANQCWIPYVSVHAGGMKSLFCVPYCSIKLCAIYPLRWLESTRCRRATAFLCRRRCLAALFDKTYGCIVRTNDEHCSMMTCGDMVTYDVLRSGAFGKREPVGCFLLVLQGDGGAPHFVPKMLGLRTCNLAAPNRFGIVVSVLLPTRRIWACGTSAFTGSGGFAALWAPSGCATCQWLRLASWSSLMHAYACLCYSSVWLGACMVLI